MTEHVSLDFPSVVSDVSVMTEIIDIHDSSAKAQFILYWGDMGSQWGVNRSVAQIHALLFLSIKPMNAEQITDELGIARSNVSNSLKELVGWKLIRRVPIRGDRREHFEAEADVWEMAMRIAQGRKEREIDPARTAIEACVTKAESEPGLDPEVLRRLKDMQDFLNTADKWYSQMLGVPKKQLNMLMKMGDKVFSVLRLTGKKSE
ncbi:DNA-binding transcriptional regulator GbsR, MarR family [Cognatiyoonia koreensis]|uniref:HTH-type transcriptional regulator n=2 Tax=Cognatiyoonia koreensis TaxID=364200 RepID=A0A1I0RX04_9RHOB|nr:DNA-binding transcriptional regulator GbsR, MarR family [Cognatiyoonia koreensis]